MKHTIRLTALAVAMAIIASCLFSCNLLSGADPTEIIKEADEALKSQPYTVLINVTYTSDDEDMSMATEKLSVPSIEMRVDGDDLYAGMTMTLYGRLLRNIYTAVDGVVYYDSYEEYGDEVKTSKIKTAFTDDTKASIVESLGGGANPCADDFTNISVADENGVSVITCTDIKDRALSDIIEVLQNKLTDINAMVLVNDATLVLRVKDGKYISSEFDCTYVIASSLDVYTVSMNSSSYFDYDTEFEIKAPVDADEYIDTSAV